MELTDNIIERFWPKVEKTDGCWEWLGAKNEFGYGVLRIAEGRLGLAHRISFAIANGVFPDDKLILHKPVICHNRLCVNPDHLYIGTYTENARDQETDKTRAKGEKVGVSKFSEDEIRQIRQLADAGVKLLDIADQFNTCYSNIYYISRRVTWRHLKD